jgi:tetrapyrrole methylase family protein/MazG family protein
VGFEQKESYKVEDLKEIMRLLRSQHGCPWDKEQTHASIRKNLLEEAYEAAEAIDLGDMGLLQEELGDVLLQVAFHAQMESEKGVFDLDGVADGVCKKLIARHPHIFADVVAETPSEVLRNWDNIKRREKGQLTYAATLESVPKNLPALMRSEKIQKRAGKAGFCYPDWQAAFKDLASELEELREAADSGDAAHMNEELGDLLFAAVNVARHLGLDAEEALGSSCGKFTRRFAEAEKLAAQRGIDMPNAGLETLDTLWEEVKYKETKFGGIANDKGRTD